MVAIEQLDQPGQFLRLQRFACQGADVAHVARGTHQGQLLPPGEAGVETVRRQQDLVEFAIAGSLAQRRRDEVVDDAIVEGVSRDTDAGLAEGPAGELAALALEANDGEVAGTATEVGHQDGGVPFQASGKEECRSNRLVGIQDIGKARSLERGLVTPQRQGIIGTRADEPYRPPDDDAPAGRVQRPAALVAQPQQEVRQHVLEGITAAQHLRLFEQGAGRITLERLDETGLARIVQIGLDRPRPRAHRPPGCVGRVMIEAQGRAEGGGGG